MVRNIFGEDLGHTISDRQINARRITSLCKGLADNGYNVLACVLSIFPDNQKENRLTIPDYREVFIDAEFKKLLERDNKDLYGKALRGEINNVVGVDIAFPRPENPDVVIDNNSDDIDFTETAVKTIESLGIALNYEYQYSKENRIHAPCKYEYVPYEGTLFLKSYISSRDYVIDVLKSNLSKLKLSAQINNLDDSFEREFGKPLRDIGVTAEDGLVNTEQLFIRLLGDVLEKRRAICDAHIIHVFIKKFEVSKRFYAYYKEDTYEKGSNNYNNVLLYILFANILAQYIRNEDAPPKRIIAFNALLKLNDTIASFLEHIVTPREMIFAYHAFINEKDFYATIKNMRGL
jgi:adenylylsulfate kinase